MGERLHEIILAGAPDLSPRTWYGMPAFALTGSTAVEEIETGALVKKAVR